MSPDDERNGALNGFPVAYFAPTYKMLMEVWRAVVALCQPITVNKSEVEKRIELMGGGVIDMWSLDTPDSIRGRKYKRIIVDEAATVTNLKYAWTEVMRPMLTDLKGDAFFLSTPKGKLNYFYDLSQHADHYTDWTFTQMPTVSNPYIDPAEVEEARNQLDPLTFAQEYLASFITENLESWAFCFSKEKHVGKTQLNRQHEVVLSFDFNKNPCSCGVFQHYNGAIYCIEMIKLENSDIYKLCDNIEAKYNGCLLVVTGDATGRASSALVHDNLNYYTVIKNKLRLSMGQIRVPTINPTMIENRVLVNSVLYNIPVTIDSERAKALIFDLEYAKVLPDGTLDKTDRKDPTKQLDAADTFRYYLSTFHKSILKV